MKKYLLFFSIIIGSTIMANNSNDLTRILSELSDSMYCVSEASGDVNQMQKLLTQSIEPIKDFLKHTELSKEDLLPEFFLAAMFGDKAILDLFLEAGFDPNVKNKSGQTPLMVAAMAGNVDTVETLLAGGADLTVRDNFGNSVEFFAQRVKAAIDSRSVEAEGELVLFITAMARYKGLDPFEKVQKIIKEKKEALEKDKSIFASMADAISYYISRVREWLIGCLGYKEYSIDPSH